MTRGSQTYKFPIYLSEEVDRTIVFYATVIPLVAYWAAQSLVIKPFIASMKRNEDKYNAEAREESRRRAKHEAESALKLMEEAYKRSVDCESSKGGKNYFYQKFSSINVKLMSVCPYRLISIIAGLVIVRAWFGKLLSSSRDDINKIIDVTIPLQCQVKDSHLIIPEGDKVRVIIQNKN